MAGRPISFGIGQRLDKYPTSVGTARFFIFAGIVMLGALSCSLIEQSEEIPSHCQSALEDTAFPEPSEVKANIPTSIIDAARQAIIDNTGNAFFEQYISYSSYHSRPHSEDTTYSVAFLLNIFDEASTRELIRLTVGESGMVHTHEISLPDCKEEPGECEFPVGEMQAKQIALEAAPAEGILAWGSRFHWHHGHDTFVWVMLNLASYSESTCGGTSIVIDANSGDVLRKGGWTLIID